MPGVGLLAGCVWDRLLLNIPSLDAAGLLRVVKRSLADPQNGNSTFQFEEDEVQYLREKALPALVEARIREARDNGLDWFRIMVRCFGPADDGHEFGWIFQLLLDHMEKRADFQGALAFDGIGFDVSLSKMYRLREYLPGNLRTRIYCSRMEDRVQVRHAGYYGDLTDATMIGAMAAFGEPDIALWRNTHVMAQQGVTAEHGWQIVEGMRASLKSHGILVVDEGLPGNEGRICLLEQK